VVRVVSYVGVTSRGVAGGHVDLEEHAAFLGGDDIVGEVIACESVVNDGVVDVSGEAVGSGDGVRGGSVGSRKVGIEGIIAVVIVVVIVMIIVVIIV
jgi:hypothetical protein